MRRRFGLLLVVLVPLLSGCLLVPLPPVTYRRTGSFEKLMLTPAVLVGDAKSSCPIRPGLHRTEVVKAIGDPDTAYADSRIDSFTFYTRWLYLILLVPGHGAGEPWSIAEPERRLDIQYDQDDRVIATKMVRMP